MGVTIKHHTESVSSKLLFPIRLFTPAITIIALIIGSLVLLIQVVFSGLKPTVPLDCLNSILQTEVLLRLNVLQGQSPGVWIIDYTEGINKNSYSPIKMLPCLPKTIKHKQEARFCTSCFIFCIPIPSYFICPRSTRLPVALYTIHSHTLVMWSPTRSRYRAISTNDIIWWMFFGLSST